MAKIVKKKIPAKKLVKQASKATAKASKTAPKKALTKAEAKKKPAKMPQKKVEAKKKAEPKVKLTKDPSKPGKALKVETSKKIEAPKKVEKKAITPPAAPAIEKSLKKEIKPPKKGKAVKKEETEIEDDFIADDDMIGDEIGEYEEELKAVEEAEEEPEIVEEWTGEEKQKTDEEVVLTDAEGRRYCRARDCDQIAVVDAYCRFHYLLFWKKIQVRKKILADGKLERYVEELTSRYPDKFLEMIRRDLRTEKDFIGAIQELEIDESANENEFEEDTSAFIEEVRGMGENTNTGVEDDEY